MIYLVDTDVIVDGLKGIRTAVVLIEQLKSDGMGVSTVALAELYEGIYGQDQPALRKREAQRFLTGFAILDVTDAIADRFGRIRRILRDNGNLIPDMDLLIAATALEHDLTLLTRNLSHFVRVPGLKIYHELTT